MKTVGEILKEARIQKNLEIDKIAEATKIRVAYLQALEDNDYEGLPSLACAKGFLKNYAEFLGLSSNEVLAVFRRDFDEKKVKKTDSLEKESLIAKPKFAWTPKLTSLVGVAILVLAFIAYLIWQYYSLINAPYY